MAGVWGLARSARAEAGDGLRCVCVDVESVMPAQEAAQRLRGEMAVLPAPATTPMSSELSEWEIQLRQGGHRAVARLHRAEPPIELGGDLILERHDKLAFLGILGEEGGCGVGRKLLILL